MFCPQCGQERISVETNYCSRCGFLLTAAADLLRTGGLNPLAIAKEGSRALSPRKRGIKQGLFIFLLTFLVAPIVGMVSMGIGIRPFGVGIAAVLFFMGGLLRMIYALMFESAEPGGMTLEEKVLAATNRSQQTPQSALPPQQAYPVSPYVSPSTGNWRDTSDLEPISVTEGTTKLLEKEEKF